MKSKRLSIRAAVTGMAAAVLFTASLALCAASCDKGLRSGTEVASSTQSVAWCDSVYTVTDHYDAESATNYHLTELKADKVSLRMALANNIAGETGTEFAGRMNCCVAFNASMGIKNAPEGQRPPPGIQIVDGKIIQELSTVRYTLGIKEDNRLCYYSPDQSATDMVKDGAHYALTGFTPLINDHHPVSDTILATVGNYSVKHPRQVIAQYDNGNILVLSCGGRGYEGEGMTAVDVIRVLSALDVRFAFMLDGGGSVTTMLNGKRITPLIDGNGTLERSRPNWLYVKYERKN